MADEVISETRAGELLGRPVKTFLSEEAVDSGPSMKNYFA